MPGLDKSALPARIDDDPRAAGAAPTRVVDPGPVPPPPAAPPRAAGTELPLPARGVRSIPATGVKIGPFTVGEALGHGGFAHVYRATGPDGQDVALKVLTSLYDGARERFELEARLLEKVGGRGFPQFVQAGLDDAQPWFAMELVPGSTLRDHVRENGPLDASRTLRLADQLVSALRVLQEHHSIHRDLKPANIMVDGDRAVLLDLGVAKVFDAATSTQPAGTLAYMAPELFVRRVHPRSDVYSLGLLLVFASTGTMPQDLNFLGRDLEPEDLVDQGAPKIDTHLLGLVLAMTRHQPDHRPALENLSNVLRARIAGDAADGTLLLADRIVEDGATVAEQALGPVTGLAPTVAVVERPTKVMQRPGTEARAARAQEPWHALVYDATLMSVLCEVHDDGFDGAAERVIADHVASIGAQVAQGTTPAEIKDWIWQAMRWRAATPPDGHPDTLRGWRAYRNPEVTPRPDAAAGAAAVLDAPRRMPGVQTTQRQVPAAQVTQRQAPASQETPKRASALPALTEIQPASDAAATRVASPAPPSIRPRKSPVQHLGPAPQPPSVRPTGAGQGRAPAPGAAPARGPAPAGAAPGLAPAPAAGPPAAARPAAGVVQRPAPPNPANPGTSEPGRRRRPWPVRVGGALLRLVPRLLVIAAIARTLLLAPVSRTQRTDPMLDLPRGLLDAIHVPAHLAGPVEGPLLAVAALLVAVLLRAAGHRMWLWFYVLVTLGSIAVAAFVTATG